jgi:hypothetical protein
MYLLANLQSRGALVVLALSLLASSTTSYCAEFQQRVRAPKLATHAELKAKLREPLEQSTMSPADRVRNAAVSHRWVDLTWQLNLMAQAGQELPDLAEFGLVKQPNGSYLIDVSENPEWETWNLKSSLMRNPQVFELHAKRLRERGFREQDIAILKQHVAQRDQRGAVIDAERSIIRSIKAYRSRTQRLEREIDPLDAASYAYQLDLARDAASKNWVADLLAKLDPQRQRILISFYQELGGTIIFAPDANFDGTLAVLAEQLISGEYEQRIAQQEQEPRQ